MKAGPVGSPGMGYLAEVIPWESLTTKGSKEGPGTTYLEETDFIAAARWEDIVSKNFWRTSGKPRTQSRTLCDGK